ncbi:MAG TPA: peptidoglycan DD-metalloendopeptidase family protein [Candidatus Polarisedimenticolaceae bacterium]|nr:peptidoglycan DD-metalloendopeptidase family protein [Candidatus Polarisedimenticolaceae bacterium]
MRGRRPAAAFLLSLVAIGVVGSTIAQQSVGRRERTRAVRDEIDRLQAELESLGRRESGLLGELERLGAELRLRDAETRAAEVETEEIRAAIDERNAALGRLEAQQADRRGYLAFRLREIYKQGPDRTLRRAVGDVQLESYLAGLRYAAFLSSRDARVLADYRTDARRLTGEREALAAREQELAVALAELEESKRRLSEARDRRSARLDEVRQDRDSRLVALDELEAAADELSRLADSFLPGADAPRLDVQKFRGLLDWPADGAIEAGFGAIVHPRFKTRLPHPGVDIGAEAGSEIRSVFDGKVVFASWMRGYGLTTIVDHGGGLISVYAHAAGLWVEPGEEVLRGGTLGMVGETGSLRGPYLYFELRENGRPVDPTEWLRRR